MMVTSGDALVISVGPFHIRTIFGHHDDTLAHADERRHSGAAAVFQYRRLVGVRRGLAFNDGLGFNNAERHLVGQCDRNRPFFMEFQLDFHPDSPLVFKGIDTDVPEFPTIPAPLQQLSETLQELPLKELFTSAQHAIQGLDRIINSPDTTETVHSLRNTFASTEDMLAANSSLRYELSNALNEFAAASRSIRILADGLHQQPETLIRGRSGFGTR